MILLKSYVKPFIMITMKLRSMTETKLGRPRTFNHDEALNEAMLAFWEYGYETTSMALLSKKMSMNAPSIYSAFGDKKALFLKALDMYVGDLKEIKTFIDSSPSAFEAADQLLKLSAVRFTGKHTPCGCMLASATASGSKESTDVKEVASNIRLKIESFLRARIERDQEDKILPKSAPADGLASLTISVIQGMSALARDGASRKKLLLIAETSMMAWGSSLR